MTLQSYLNSINMTKYNLSQISGVPKTTVIDICSGKSTIEKCSAKTVYKLAKALGCTMEEIMEMDRYDIHTGKPLNKEYLECDLPSGLKESIDRMVASWEKIDNGEFDIHWDLNWSELNSDINFAEVNQVISSDQAWYLREKYLRMER